RQETEVSVGEKTYAAVLKIEENLELEIIPDLLRLSGAAGEVITRELTIVNHGNVAIEVPRAGGFGLFEDKGLERAIGEVFMNKKGDGVSMLDQIAERARDAHGGFV